MDAVYRLSYAILGDEADARDAAQESFVAAWRQLGRLRDPERFDVWLQRIAVNAARQTIRARRRRRIREISPRPWSRSQIKSRHLAGTTQPSLMRHWQLFRSSSDRSSSSTTSRRGR
jgi:DNA-directed RNA polymerase specialized sigma24 family protein